MSRLVRRVLEGDERERLICLDCDFVAHENPKIVVGSIVSDNDRVLLCRRAIEPRARFWTIPAGYMEMGETVAEGAQREAWEEARARIAIEGVLAVYSIARLSQVQIIFRAKLAVPSFEPGPESLEVKQFDWGEIPWDEIAFPSVRWALRAWHETRRARLPAAILNPPQEDCVTPPRPSGQHE